MENYYYEIVKSSAEASRAKRLKDLETDRNKIIENVFHDFNGGQVLSKFDSLEEAREELKKYRCNANPHKAQIGYILDVELYYIEKILVEDCVEYYARYYDIGFENEIAEFEPELPTTWEEI